MPESSSPDWANPMQMRSAAMPDPGASGLVDRVRDPVISRLARINAGKGSREDHAWFGAVVERMAGGTTWQAAITAEARAERDRAICQLRIERYHHLRDRPAADEALARDLGRYEASGWRRDRLAPSCPHPPAAIGQRYG
jgi:hypothetical protein